MNAEIILGEKSKRNARTEPKNSLTKSRTGSRSATMEVLDKVDIVVADGRASITASAKSLMKEEVQPRAGTRPQFSIPDSRAKCLYSISISSRVSMCSLTKLEIQRMYN